MFSRHIIAPYVQAGVDVDIRKFGPAPELNDVTIGGMAGGNSADRNGGGIFLGLNESVSYEMGFKILLLLFAAVVLGGLGSAYGVMVGGFVVGIVVGVVRMPVMRQVEIAEVPRPEQSVLDRSGSEPEASSTVAARVRAARARVARQLMIELRRHPVLRRVVADIPVPA